MWLEFFNFLHFVGLAFGVGGATIATIISRKSEKDQDVAKTSMKIMSSISKLMGLGLFLLIVSGIALPFFITWPLDRNMLITKHVLVLWIIIIGIIIGKSSKTMKDNIPLGNQKPNTRFLAAKKRVKAFSMINLFLWYLVTLQSVFV